MLVHSESEEELQFHSSILKVHVRHRDWNPMPGFEDEAPEGGVWEAFAIDKAGGDHYAAGVSKEEVLNNLLYSMGLKHGSLYPKKLN